MACGPPSVAGTITRKRKALAGQGNGFRDRFSLKQLLASAWKDMLMGDRDGIGDAPAHKPIAVIKRHASI